MIIVKFFYKVMQGNRRLLQEIHLHRHVRLCGHSVAQSDHAIQSWSVAGFSPVSADAISRLVPYNRTLPSVWRPTAVRFQLSAVFVLFVQCALLSR